MTEKLKKSHPVDRSNIISQLCFCWLLPYFIKGYKTVLSEDDMYQNRKVHDSEMLGNKLETVWNKTKTSLAKDLCKVFLGEYLLICSAAVIAEICKLFQPFLIFRILLFFDQNSLEENKTDVYIYAILLIILSALSVSISHYFSLQAAQVGMKMRIACSSLIYRKALKLNQKAFVKTSTGQIVNLLSNDVGRLENTIHLNHLFMAPIETLVVMVLIYFSVGWYGLIGALCLIASMFLTSFLGKKSGKFRLSTAKRTDKRMLLMNQILSGIEVVKMFAWEKLVGDQVESVREKEIRKLKLNSLIRSLTAFLSIALSKLAMFASILAYILTGNVLSSSYVFTLGTFFRLLQTVTIFFPLAAAHFAEMLASIGRIQQYLQHEDFSIDGHLDEGINNKNGTGQSEEKIDFNGSIVLSEISAKWPNSSSDCFLNIDLKIKSGELVTLIGPSGSGKTTLLNVILHELCPSYGSVKVSGTISYASQTPWLFGETLKENILFGEQYNEKKYNEVIKVCALDKDFALLPFGDGTLSGDRGSTLSGGQRARINLARAIYRDADIYLLDDPLSAVDNKVGKQIVETCLLGYLKNKTVLLVTHQIQYLKNLDNIYLLKNGLLKHFASYKELKENASEYFVDYDKILAQDDDNFDSTVNSEHVESQIVSNQTQKLVKEDRRKGKVSRRVYEMYFLACGHWFQAFLMVALFILAQTVDSVSEYFISFWINNEQNKHLKATISANYTTVEIPENDRNFLDTNWYISTIFHGSSTVTYYSLLVALVLTLTFTKSIYFYLWCLKVSSKMHKKMLNKILYNPMKFFNENPSGRVLNRFSKDMGILDEIIPPTLYDALHIGFNLVAICTIIGCLNPWTLAPSSAVFVLAFYMRKVFLETSRDVKRVESVTRGPLYTHLTESLDGISIIRTFRVQEKFKKEFDMYQNIHSSAFFMFLGAARTYGFWLDMLSVFYIGCVIFFLLFIKKEEFGGNLGLALNQAMWLTQALQRGMRQWGEFENQMVSVERIQEYINLDSEVDNRIKPPQNWPQKGKIEYRNVTLRYSKGSVPALDVVSFTIEPKEKIGVVGRTGAGKSSLLRGLSRLIDYHGKIIVDDIEIKTISLQTLRSKISVISQVPLLFSGTIRKNLDPFEKYNDEVLWKALEEVEMKSNILKLPESLDTLIIDSVSNFSIGQRQLLCLARAIINRNQILFLDEATSNVDPYTDSLIQKSVRGNFAECTVITIAHRLQTIMDSDRVMVMDNGKVVEFDSPKELLKKKDGYFYSLVVEIGRTDDQKPIITQT